MLFITDAHVLLYTSEGVSTPAPAIIDTSKLGLYGSPVTVADFAQSPSVTYMASILSQVIR